MKNRCKHNPCCGDQFDCQRLPPRMTSPELDKAEAVLPPMAEDLIELVRSVAEPLNAEITRLSSELAASRDREMALERDAEKYRNYAAEKSNQYVAERKAREAAEAEVKRLRADTIEECAKVAVRVQYSDPEEAGACAAFEIAAAIRALATTGLQGGGTDADTV